MPESRKAEVRKRTNMTDLQIQQIRRFRSRGYSLAQTAEALQLPVSTVKTFCYRHPEQAVVPIHHGVNHCRHCGVELEQTSGKKKKVFCSNSCSYQWWKENRLCYSHHPQAPSICLNCNIQFFGVRKNQKFCSHACYIQYRYYRKSK